MVNINLWALAVIIIDLVLGILLYRIPGFGPKRSASIAGWIGTIIGLYGLVISGVLTDLALAINFMFLFTIITIVAILMAVFSKGRPDIYLNKILKPLFVHLPALGIFLSFIIMALCQILQP